ncbi:hypothetical protein SY83_14720 [Paenibacillus swuensis]|uniref:Phosphatidylinositol kinase n=1 Tax=Paenibacillus swuensis TaxID=1178515 RepID=A0A172TJT6_9BACL|nr:hypothetical protein [Paenibacillus swuensis]ANE47311.1 hypothetical protein SY83_14720 [Paenibacillus swuensis]
MNLEEKKKLCKDHMHRYVSVQTTDGGLYDGIVEDLDDEYLYLAVPATEPDYRGFSPLGYPYQRPPYYPYYPQYPYYQYPYGRRRFNRLGLPLAGLLGLSLLPYY